MLPTLTRRALRPYWMPSLFDDDFFPVLNGRTSSMPAVNIKEDDKKYSLDEVLTIQSETKDEHEETTDGYRRKEFSYSSFCRSFQIPENVDKEKIEANYKDGILSVMLPKAEEEKSKIARQVKIS